MRRSLRARHDRNPVGFTLIELLLVVAVMGITLAMAVPSVQQAMRLFAVNNARQQVSAAIRSARYTAVSKNRRVRIRFNCPSTAAFRVVEVVGAAIDSASDRCSEASYPYPDLNAAVVPDVDGPVMRLPVAARFAAFQDMEFATDGRVIPLTGCPACNPGTGGSTITLTNGTTTRTIAVTANGRISLE